MFESERLDGVVPEDSISNHISTINKSSLQQFKLSLPSCSNITSHILLEDFWQKHKEEFCNNIDNITESIDSLLQNRNRTNITTWETSLSKLQDVAELVPFCEECSTKSTIYNNLESFGKNQCQCNIGTDNTFVKKLNSNEIKCDEQRSGVFKPRFGKLRTKNIQQNKPNPSEQIGRIGPISQAVDSNLEDDEKAHKSAVAKITFKSAKEHLLGSNPAMKRTLGATKKAYGKFVSPMIGALEKSEEPEPQTNVDDRLKHLDPKMIELIESEIIDKGTPIMWEDIAGLEMAKSVIQEAVVWPLLRPDIFTGLRRPPKGILLFGPPGTGKTLIGKCVAAQCNATFFNISASSLTSKWIGDGEKMVRTLFAVARIHQPAVIFIDEIDSLLTQRSDSEHEATRRIKTEFLVQFDGAGIGEEDRLLIVGATNRPHELDEAARRRLVKRLYIPLPELEARKQIISNLLKSESNNLTADEVEEISRQTEGFSGADMKSLCSEAAMGPIRSVPLSQIVSIQRDKVRPVCVQDFFNALQRVRPSVSQDDLGQYVKWNKTYGQGF